MLHGVFCISFSIQPLEPDRSETGALTMHLLHFAFVAFSAPGHHNAHPSNAFNTMVQLSQLIRHHDNCLHAATIPQRGE